MTETQTKDRRSNPATIAMWDNADKVVEQYLAGEWPPTLAQRYGVSPTTIKKLLKTKNVKRRLRSEDRIHSFDEAYFERIDSHEKAQILGFIYADGCIAANGGSYKLHIRIHAKDIDYLERIKTCIGYTGPIRRFTSWHGKPHCSLLIFSRKLGEDLIRLGAGIRKTYNLTFPSKEQIPDEFLDSFILGFLEGDGSIYSNAAKRMAPTLGRIWRKSYVRVSFCGTFPFLSALKSRLDNRGILTSSLHKDHSIYSFVIADQKSLHLFLDSIYKNAPFVMKRKHDRYLAFKSPPPTPSL